MFLRSYLISATYRLRSIDFQRALHRYNRGALGYGMGCFWMWLMLNLQSLQWCTHCTVLAIVTSWLTSRIPTVAKVPAWHCCSVAVCATPSLLRPSSTTLELRMWMRMQMLCSYNVHYVMCTECRTHCGVSRRTGAPRHPGCCVCGARDSATCHKSAPEIGAPTWVPSHVFPHATCCSTRRRPHQSRHVFARNPPETASARSMRVVWCAFLLYIHNS
jgi:hypothetical protein